jgi:hypothetical protein
MLKGKPIDRYCIQPNPSRWTVPLNTRTKEEVPLPEVMTHVPLEMVTLGLPVSNTYCLVNIYAVVAWHGMGLQ